ncbi:very short patch repair endonuclease [Hyphomonas jannaschiana]|uniref:Very short patch repair endonuclease n=1 Tax=Hyphomonas jannaschiana VP2 TaxID=1280952 RepID=A0A059FL98_9PROT|nr:DNA mismatch endonuclease Vsr [Hyphomonas jannaschiana]KCZ91311.1 T/G mismatch-specific endonuclease [Hyphomonas jannaschiana VP2]
MADVVSPEVRSRMMSGIRGKDTKPEMIVRRGLHAMGFRYKLHDKRLPGRPDLVLPKYRAVIFVHGCFWHKHDCKYFKWPKTRKEFWRSKIEKNVARDKTAMEVLKNSGWRVAVVWECSFRDASEVSERIRLLGNWVSSDRQEIQISGDPTWN